MKFDMQFAIDTFWVALAGVPTTLLITVVALLISLPLGFFIALTRVYRIPILNSIAVFYISFVRGTPLIVQIFIIYTSVPRLLAYVFQAHGVAFNIYSVNPLYYAFLVFGINASAGFAEMWRAALNSVGRNQMEAAHSVGLTTAQGYWHIIIPQALVVAAPSICSTSLHLLKNTSLVFVMSVMDITARAKIIAGVGYKYFEAYVDIFIIYLIVCVVLEKLFKLAENKIRTYKIDAA